MSISVSHQPFNFEKIPPPILRDIFCHESFDMQTLAKVSSLSKYLRSDVFNDTFWKQIVYQRFAFSTKSWQKCFGDQVVSNENLEEELKTCPGIEFLKDVKRFSAIFPETSPYERLALVRVPKTLCGRLYVEVLPKLMGWFIKCPIRHIDYLFCNSTCFYISVQELTIHKSVWVIMTTKVLPDSFDKKFSAQKKLFEHFKINDYQPPKFLETIATIFAYFFNIKFIYFLSLKESTPGLK